MIVSEKKLKEIKTDAQIRFKLYQDVFCSDNGQLLLAFMESFYTGKPDLTNNNVTYFNLGMREVVNQIIEITKKELK